MQRLTLALGLVALATVLVACSGASAAPATGAPASPTGPGATSAPAGDAIPVIAKDLVFVPAEISVPADTAITIDFDNQDSAPHNIAISDAAGASVFKGEIVSSAKVTYSIPALAPGSYPFICEVHPDMKGTITAQ